MVEINPMIINLSAINIVTKVPIMLEEGKAEEYSNFHRIHIGIPIISNTPPIFVIPIPPDRRLTPLLI